MKTLDDMDFKGKRVLVRVDFNVPIKDGKITDDSRIVKSLPTFEYILKHNPQQVIVITHFGRPNNEYNPEFSVEPICIKFMEHLGKFVDFNTNPRLSNINSIGDNQIVMLENLRFDAAETTNDEFFARHLASFADCFVFDAFGAAHRNHASVVSIPRILPSCMGRLMQKEILFLRDKMIEPKKPFIGIIGGAKADKINVMKNLLEKVDYLIIGGIMANTFLKAKGFNIGNSKFDQESLQLASSLLENYDEKIVLPIDYILGKSFEASTQTSVATKLDVIDGWMIMDIGPNTIEGYKDVLTKAKTIVWAGPIGVFEWPAFRKGTQEIAQYVASLKATTIIGGGDSGEAVALLDLEQYMTHVSTGGGASLELLAGHQLPAIQALEQST